MSRGRLATSVIILLAVGMAVSACGRRPSALMTPYEAAVEERRQAERDDQPLPPPPTPPQRDRPFILDRLI